MAEYPDAILTETDDRRSLELMLEIQRAEIARLLDHVDEAEARTRLVPSLTTVLGLVKHATFVEQVWFHHRVDGRSRAEVGIPETVEESFQLTQEDTLDSVRDAFGAACARSREIAALHPDIDEMFAGRVGQVSLRFIHTHLIQEFARHAGHGDILVEQLVAARTD